MKNLISIPLILVLTSCSISSIPFVGNSGTPGDNELRNQVMPLLVNQNFNDTVEVRNLHKTNGYETNAKTYTVDIGYDLVFKVNFADLLAKQAPGANAALKNSGLNNPQATVAQNIDAIGGGITALNLGAMRLVYGDFKAGESIKQQDRVTFTKSENGWQLSSQPKTVP
jgi:hypothetical protein